MTKTPEQMAKEYANESGWLEDGYIWREAESGFLAGYQAAQQWISVKERLPEEGQDVLVFDEGIFSVKSLSSYTHKWHPYENGFDCEPSHWQPLPKPPEGK